MNMINALEKLLSERFDAKVRLDRAGTLQSSGRSKVNRLHLLDRPQSAPQSVIVKEAVAIGREVYNPALPGGPAWRLFNEWAGLQFLTETCGENSPAPRFYAGDRDLGLIVLEDLGDCKRLDQALLGDDPVYAEAMLVAFAATLGRMHALTIGKQAEFDRIRNSLGPRESDQHIDKSERLATMLRNLAQMAGVEPALGIDEELRIVSKDLAESVDFHAYLHCDPCPDNCLITEDGLKLVDFEFGGYGHALMDGIYGRIHFPTCWCVNRLPEHIPLKMEAAYRAEFIKGCPEAADDERFYRAVVEACAARLINAHNAQMLIEDRQWGISTMRQRALLRFDIFWKMSEEYGHLKSIGATVGALAKNLRAQWPAGAHEMPYYPAFRN